jgi:predicted Zn-dependent protease
MLSRDQASKIIEKALSFASADDCTVTVGEADQAQTRFANNTITTSGRVQSLAVTIASTMEARTGRVVINETSDEALKAAADESAQLARFSPPDPEYMEPEGPQEYAAIDSFDPATARSTQAEFLPAVRAAVNGATAKKVTAYGYIERTAQALAHGNKRGNFGYTTLTDSRMTLTVRTPDGTGSGWSAFRSRRLGDLDPKALARVAIDKAILSMKPRALEPGKYTVILEPEAVAGILGPMSGSFNARNAEEGRSAFTKRGGGTLLGEKLFSEKITMRTDPSDPRISGLPWQGGIPSGRGGGGGFGGGGGAFLPVRPMVWIEKGVLKSLAYSRYWAAQRKVDPTPFPSGAIVEGENHSLEDLIKSTDRGLLVTNFWYIRFVNPQTVQLTGLTRDGLFMIEKGKIAYPVQNFRWNESPITMLANVEMLSRSERVTNAVLPAMKVRDFNFTSISDAV